jgi:glycine dehydrogenase subunit 2
MIRAYHVARGERRTKVLVPDSAHGTNPASTAIAGYRVVQLKADAEGGVDLGDLERHLDAEVAALMITVPNTLGLFEPRILEITERCHAQGAQVYMDGANLNAVLGIARPGDLGFDVCHFNLHKTFTTPHGGGGPGAGPVGVKAHLEPYLPVPRVAREAERYRFDWDHPRSIGRVHAFWGNFGMLVRAYAYIRSLGAEGLTQATEQAVLNARYLRARLEGAYEPAVPSPMLHEVVFSDHTFHDLGVSTLDVAKRLLDYGFHPPTIYFPLIVPGALMVEPTESEPRQELDAFVAAMLKIREEAEREPQLLKSAPHHTPVRRLDEVAAARRPRLRWRPEARD